MREDSKCPPIRESAIDTAVQQLRSHVHEAPRRRERGWSLRAGWIRRDQRSCRVVADDGCGESEIDQTNVSIACQHHIFDLELLLWVVRAKGSFTRIEKESSAGL